MPFADAARRNRSVGSNDGYNIFVKDEYPVAFFFHTSVREGRDVLEQNITSHGGYVCGDEKRANVMLVDEEADIEHIRRRYYRSHVLWQQRVYIESRDFVHQCIRAKKYEHRPPARKGMPGAPGGRVRVPFTADDDDHLAFYIATVYPDPSDGGRTGNSFYQELTEELADEPEYKDWAKRHTWQSWRERYRMNRVRFDPMIAMYAAQLKPVAHGFGHDPRSRRFKNGEIAHREEEEEESDQEPEQQAERGAGSDDLNNRVPDGIPQARNQVQDNDMRNHEPSAAQPQLRRRRRDDPDTSQRANFQGESSRKRQRVASPATPSESRTSTVEKGRWGSDHGSPGQFSIGNDRRSPEERSVAWGALDGAIGFDNDQMPQLNVLPVPRSPEHDVPQSDEPLATQQTLVNSPTNVRSRQVPSARATAVVVQAASMNSQAISIAQPLRAARRPPSRRGRAQREQSLAAGTEIQSQVKRIRTSSKSRGNQPAVVASDAPYRHTRARSQSVDLPPQPAPASKRQRVVSAKGKMKEPELEEVTEEDAERNLVEGDDSQAHIYEDVGLDSQGSQISIRRPEAETFQEQQDVEDHLLKEGSSLFTDEEQSDESSDEQQEFTADSSSEDPSDSDDAATHKNLQRDGQRLNRMAAAGFRTRLPSTSVSASNKARMTTRSSAIRVTRHAA
ncbi:uncharacterized protein F5147DRAFT_696263 [Suillus discolor]|uniref:TERF2-interacting telomeric protein 1 Myb domain-containing protein n=1 Tax=Suillus discolor TaxID=1912936 RepID=A0A9P7JTY8_9AGAM|nr:uncharacterized protein F5147DRAFT_696263 [Suillus discolor]KAG2108018.1 hypothetical protein F5147DRAFT_696263 [Suillus discolor]